MTMPHLMNCSHISYGWCLDCVGELHAELAREHADHKDAIRDVDALVAAERERCAAVLRARIEKIAAEAERAAINEPDEESALRAMAWQLTVAEREILWPNVLANRPIAV